MITKEGSTKIVTFMTLVTGVLALGCGHISHIVEMHFSYKNLLLYSQAYFRQTKYIEMMTKKMVYQNSMTPWVGVVKLCIILMMCINIQHIYCYGIKGLK